MADAFALANAFVRIRSEATGFRAEADRQIRTALAGLNPSVKIGASTLGAKAAARDLKGYLDALTKQNYDFRLVVDDKLLQARLAKIFVQLVSLQGMMVNPKITLMGYARMQAELLALGAEMEQMARRVSVAHVNVEGNAEKQLALLRTQIVALTAQAHDIKLGITDAAGLAAIAAIQKALAAVSSHVATLTIGTDVTQIAAAEHTLAQLSGMLVTLRGTATAAAGGGGGGGGIRGLRGMWGGWNQQLSATIPILGATITTVGLLHIAIDAVVETLIAVTLAAASAALGIAAMAPAAQDVVTHMKAVQTVTDSLGQTIPPLTGKWTALTDAMAPRVIEAFGGVLDVIGRKAGTLVSAAGPVVNMFDTWIAKIDLWAASQGGLAKVLQSGMGFLHQFGQIFGNLGSALGNLIKADPGTAHFLGDIVVAASKLVNIVSQIPSPILFAVLALHSIAVWGRLAGVALAYLSGYVVRLGQTLLALAVNPLVWVAVAAAGVAYLASQFGKASSSAQGFITNMTQQLGSANATQAIQLISTDIGQLNDKIRTAGSRQSVAAIEANWHTLGGAVSQVDAQLQSAGHNFRVAFDSFNKTGLSNQSFAALGDAFKALVVPPPASAQVMNNIRAYQAEINHLLGQQGNLFRETGLLVRSGRTWAQALALMDLAGVKANDTFAIMRQKVNNLILGYEKMSIQGGILDNSVNAVTFTTLQQQSGIANLTAGWDAFFTMVTGSSTGFVTFQQDMLSVAQALSNAGGSARTVTTTFGVTASAVVKAAQKSGASMTGLNAASLQLQSTWNASAAAAQQEADALLSQASASGLGAKGTDLVTASVKDMVAQMLPGAKNSKIFTTALYALAQQGGFRGVNSFKALSGWVKTASGSIAAAKNPAKQLQRNVETLTGAVGNLKQDVQNLSVALGTTLSDAMAKAITLASGGQQPFDNFAKAVFNTGANSKTTRDAANVLGKELVTVYGNAFQARKQFETLAIAGLHLTRTEADKLWNSFIRQQLTSAASKAGTTKASFDKLATSLGVSKTKADNLWTSLHRLPANVTSNVHVNTPHAFIFAEKSGGVNNPIGELHINQSAKGSRVPGYGGGDRHLYLLEGGEAVVSKEMTAKHANTLASWGVPGMAGGGVITPLPGMVSSALGQDEGAALLANVNAALKADIAAGRAANKKAAATAALGKAPPGSGPYQAYARKLFPAMGWGMDQWAPFNAIVMQESGWNPNAQNPTSTAYGIGQFLDTTWGNYGGTGKTSNPYAQIFDMELYIKGRYGNPANAEAFHLAHNSYAAGTGSAAAGWALVGENGAELVKMNGGETVLPAGQSRQVAGFAKGTHNRLNEKVDRVLRFLHGNPNDPAAFTRLEDHLALVSASVHSERLLVRSGRLHGATLRHEREQLADDRQEQKRLLHEIRPYSKTRKWVHDVIGALGTRDALFAKEAAAAAQRHMPHVAAHFQGRVKTDAAHIKTMNTWLDRVAKVYTRRQQSKDTRWIDSVIIEALKDAGLPVVSFDRGGWLQPGATLAVNNTGKREKIGGGGEAATVRLEFGTGPHGTVEAALWNWLLHSVDVKGGGDVQVALGRKA